MRDDLPTGTVTLLFTDIEGSTHVLQQPVTATTYSRSAANCCVPRSSAARPRSRHTRRSFFVAFARATDAVSAAVDTQRTLASHAFPMASPCASAWVCIRANRPKQLMGTLAWTCIMRHASWVLAMGARYSSHKRPATWWSMISLVE